VIKLQAINKEGSDMKLIVNIIYKAIVETTEIADCLAKYNESPAVFYQTAPSDTDPLWGGAKYPRMDYNVNWQYSADRNRAGTMTINVWCLNESKAPEEIGVCLAKNLSEMFLTDDSATFCMVWNKTEAIFAEGAEPQILGVTILFDVLAFPTDESGTTPDPIKSLNLWAKANFENINVIGLDKLPSLLRPDDAKPFIYFRMNNSSNAMRNTHAQARKTSASNVMKNTHDVAWMNAKVMGHVIAPNSTVRLTLLKRMIQKMAVDGEILMDDNSPMLLINPVSYDLAANPLKVGQLNIEGTYGILREYKGYDVMNHINVSKEKGES